MNKHKNRSVFPVASSLASLLLLSLLTFGCQREQPSAAKKEPIQIPKYSAADSALKSQAPDTITSENHMSVMDMILGKPKHQIKSIGILVYDGVNDLDVMGPRYVLGQSGARTQLISLKPGQISTVMGVTIIPDTYIDSVEKLDLLLIPGGFRGTVEAMFDDHLHRWIRRIDSSTVYTASVCNGAWILGATGLLEGKKVTTNWYRAEEMMKNCGATFTHERYTQDGKYWTAAGVTAGLDMSLAILNENWGERYAQGVMLDMEYDPAPPITGGTPEKTSWLVEWLMRSMYDAGINPLMDSLRKASLEK